MSCVLKWSINPVSNPRTPSISTPYDNMYVLQCGFMSYVTYSCLFKVTNCIRSPYTTKDCIILILNMLSINRRHTWVEFTQMCLMLLMEMLIRADVWAYCHQITYRDPSWVHLCYLTGFRLELWDMFTELVHMDIFFWKGKKLSKFQLTKSHSMINTNSELSFRYKTLETQVIEQTSVMVKLQACIQSSSDLYLSQVTTYSKSSFPQFAFSNTAMGIYFYQTHSS
jgi:hypothetical protein